MSFDPRGYDGVTLESERAERDELRALSLQADKDRTAREMAFRETLFCELQCYETCVHTVGCQMTNEPVTAALGAWRRSQVIAIRESEAA